MYIVNVRYRDSDDGYVETFKSYNAASKAYVEIITSPYAQRDIYSVAIFDGKARILDSMFMDDFDGFHF